MVSDTVVAIVPEDVLPELLSKIHHAGLGHTARVLRPRRQPIQTQLQRAGIPTAGMPPRVNDAEAVLIVMAAGRSPSAANLALRTGASAIWIVSRADEWALVDDYHVAHPTPEATEWTSTSSPFLPATDVVSDAPD